MNLKPSSFLKQNFRPKWLTERSYPKSEGPLICRYAESQCVIVKDSIGGRVNDPLRMRDWQEALLSDLFALDEQGRRIHRTALVGVARKNGKSALMAAIAMYEFTLGVDGGEILLVALDREQAKLIFNTVLQMLRKNPNTRNCFTKNREVLTHKETGTTLRACSRDAASLEGTSPTLAICDELHTWPSDKMWNVLVEGTGARANPLIIAITTAGVLTDRFGQPTICRRLYEHGKRVASGEIDDPTFFFAWWEPADGDRADHTDPQVWAEANPGLGDIVSSESFADSLAKNPEADFRTKRCNQWVASMNSAFPAGMWESRSDENRRLEPGERIVLGFDGSLTNDATALIACTLDGFLQPIGVWEKPRFDAKDWKVPSAEVIDTIRSACDLFDVVEIAYDPAYWKQEMEVLQAEGYPAVEYPCSQNRMVPCWDGFYRSVADGELTHSDDLTLNRHINNLVLKQTNLGFFPTKEFKSSEKKIDAAIAGMIAFDRAGWHSNQPLYEKPLVHMM